jgi:hypothetical protein
MRTSTGSDGALVATFGADLKRNCITSFFEEKAYDIKGIARERRNTCRVYFLTNSISNSLVRLEVLAKLHCSCRCFMLCVRYACSAPGYCCIPFTRSGSGGFRLQSFIYRVDT